MSLHPIDGGINEYSHLITEELSLVVIIVDGFIQVRDCERVKLDPNHSFPPVRLRNSSWLIVLTSPDSISASRSLAI